MKTFLNWDRPVLTAMVKSKTLPDILAEIERIKQLGTDAIGLQMESWPAECRTPEALRTVFQAIGDCPGYITNYRRKNKVSQCDDVLAEQLLTALDCGATLIDIYAGIYCPGSDMDSEYTVNEAAVEKQKALIREIHNRGGEVLLSSHMHRFLPTEAVMTIARDQYSRGADIAKVVTDANSQAELDENFETLLHLKRSGIPTLFLCNGSYCLKHRRIGPVVGASPLFLVTDDQIDAGAQPKLSTAKAILENLGYMDLPTGGK